jgi:hypothetical protein
MSDDTPSKAMQERMKPRLEKIVTIGPYTPGMTLPDPKSFIMVALSDGTTVPLSLFGEPPADLPYEDWDEWYADRDEELVTAKLNGGTDASGA